MDLKMWTPWINRPKSSGSKWIQDVPSVPKPYAPKVVQPKSLPSWVKPAPTTRKVYQPSTASAPRSVPKLNVTTPVMAKPTTKPRKRRRFRRPAFNPVLNPVNRSSPTSIVMQSPTIDTLTSGVGSKTKALNKKGTTIPSYGVGDITQSNFYSILRQRSRVFAKTLAMAENLEWTSNSYYRMSTNYPPDQPGTAGNTVVNQQTIADMSFGKIALNSTTSGTYNTAIMNGNGFDGGSTISEGMINSLLNQFLTSNTIEAPKTNRIYVSGVSVDTMITNVSATSVLVDIYEVVARHDNDIYKLPNTSFSGNIAELSSPVAYWSYGMSVNSGAFTPVPPPKMSAQTLGSKPWDSMLFRAYWKIAACTTVELSVGAVHKHKSNYTYNMVLDQQRYSYSPNLQNITRNLLFVLRGTPVYDKEKNNNIASGPATVNITHDIVVRAKALTYSTVLTADLTQYADVPNPSIIGPNTYEQKFAKIVDN